MIKKVKKGFCNLKKKWANIYLKKKELCGNSRYKKTPRGGQVKQRNRQDIKRDTYKREMNHEVDKLAGKCSQEAAGNDNKIIKRKMN